MPRIADALERESRTVDLEHGDFERLLARRERKQRNRRIRAGAVAVIVTLATAAFLVRAVRLNVTPANPNPPKPIGAGEVLYGGTARDPDTGAVRSVVDPAALPAGSRSITASAWSYDHGWVAFRASSGGSFGGSIWIADAVTGAPRKVSTASGYTRWAWSPTEDELVVVRGRDVSLVDAATGRRTDLGTAVGNLDSEGEVVHTLAWSPDGARIAYDGADGIYSIDVKSGEQSMLVRQPAGLDQPIDIEWSPDGTHLAVSYYSSTWRHQSLFLGNADGSHLHLLVHSSEVGMAWSPDGSQLAYTDLSGADPRIAYELWTVSMDGSAPSLLASRCCVSGGVWVAWSPDGSQIAFDTEHDGGTSHVYLVVNADGTGEPSEISDLIYRSWGGGSYFCSCYG
jgi:Tol biopolymer transport system component